MPIPKDTPLNNLPNLLIGKINRYNFPGVRTADYNKAYNNYILARNNGINEFKSVCGWVKNGNGSESINSLLVQFGMNARGSVLVDSCVLRKSLESLPSEVVDWVAGFALPLPDPLCKIRNEIINQNLSGALFMLFNQLAAPGAVTIGGGFVAASKTLHCLFPLLAPMIDGSHSGLSYYHISRNTYTPPLNLKQWDEWIGMPLNGVVNPSPRGGGRLSWDAIRFLLAIGINQHIYELWEISDPGHRLDVFCCLDEAHNQVGIPRIIDKLLW